MNLVQITPGTGGLYCGNCVRDNALVAELRRQGHDVLMLPMYLPLKLDEPDASGRVPIFFSGLNVYLQQQAALFRALPSWLHRWLASPTLLRLAGRFAAKTRAEEVGALTLSMLDGESGNQSRELEELIAWLRTQPRPDLVCLSNALLLGLARRLRHSLGVPIVCMLAGEDAFLDALPHAVRGQAWNRLIDRARDVDLFLAPSRYFARWMQERLQLSPDRLQVVPIGINLEGYPPLNADPTPPPAPPPGASPPVLGYLARMCPEKGLDTLVDAFILLKQRPRTSDLQLQVAGSCAPSDQRFVTHLRTRLTSAGFSAHAHFHPNLDRASKIAFLRRLTVFSVPAVCGEAFGLYLAEALAAGVPVVQPRHAAFPELIEETGGGLLCDPGSPQALADRLEELLLNPDLRRRLRTAGQSAARAKYGIEHSSLETLAAFQRLIRRHSYPFSMQA